jgi:hypothetical protein
METMQEAIARLRADGYVADFSAAPGGRLRCVECGDVTAAGDAVVEVMVRFEGESNPDDEAILVALSTRCGHRGLYVSAYGNDASSDDVQVLQALTDR